MVLLQIFLGRRSQGAKAEVCKISIISSNLIAASKFFRAEVAELADARDLKSLGSFLLYGFDSRPRQIFLSLFLLE